MSPDVEILSEQQVRSRFSEVADAAREGRETTITRDGEAYVALVDVRRLDYYHRLEREHVHLTLLSEAEKGLDDIARGRHCSVGELREKYGR